MHNFVTVYWFHFSSLSDVSSLYAPLLFIFKMSLLLSPSVTSNSAAPWTVARQAPLPMEFSKYEYWSGLPFPTPGNLPDSGSIKPASPVSPALAGRFFTTSTTWETPYLKYNYLKSFFYIHLEPHVWLLLFVSTLKNKTYLFIYG